MSYSEKHRIILVKLSKRHLNDETKNSNLTALITSVITKSRRVAGWNMTPVMNKGGTPFTEMDAGVKEVDAGFKYVTSMTVALDYSRDDGKRPGAFEMASILKVIYDRASTPAFGNWTLSQVEYEFGTFSSYIPPDAEGGTEVPADAEEIGYAEFNLPDAASDEWQEAFAHLFGLDYHIAQIHDALSGSRDCAWKFRFNCALIGAPGCGKSDIAGTVKKVLGDEAVMEFDATAMTAAGAIKELSERDILPRVLIVEEIEKADEKSLSFLLAMCDLRGEIRKVTARTNLQRDTKVFVIATVNDDEKFRTIQSGALFSRFSNKIYFDRPTRDHLALILNREVSKLPNGNPEWITHTLDYCETQGITDPRTVISICLCGRDKLITGEYQKMLTATAHPASK
jgi:hypothetical protein